MMQFETKQQMMKISTTILHARPLIPHLTTTNSINELNRMLTNNPICLKNSSRIVKESGAVDLIQWRQYLSIHNKIV